MSKTQSKANTKKEAYLDRVATQTSYPVLRGLIAFRANLLFGLALVCVVIGFLGALNFRDFSSVLAIVTFVASILIGAVVFILGRIVQEGLSLFVDVADSILDLNSRYE